MKSIQLEKYEHYRDIRYYVKEYHAEVIVNSDEFNALVAEHEQTFQQLRMDFIEREMKSRLELTEKQELIKRLVKERHDYDITFLQVLVSHLLAALTTVLPYII